MKCRRKEKKIDRNAKMKTDINKTKKFDKLVNDINKSLYNFGAFNVQCLS